MIWSETPKSESTNFEFVDRRKLKAQEERSQNQSQERPEVRPAESAPEQKAQPPARAPA